MQNSSDHIDVVIPVYTPEEGWISKIQEEWKKVEQELYVKRVCHLIVVNDDKRLFTDQEYKALSQLEELKSIEEVSWVEYEGNQGKGFAIRAGLKACNSRIMVYSDYDFPYGVEVIHLMAEKLDQGAEVVIAIRNQDYFNRLNLMRRVISKGLIAFNKWLLGLNHADTQAGLKAVDVKGRDAILGGKENGFLFEVEWIRQAERQKLNISTIEVELREGVDFSGILKLQPLRLITSYLRLLFRGR